MPLDLNIILLLLLFGLMVGTIASIVGLGGGVFYVSILILIFLIPIEIAVDTSTFVILIATAIGFITYYRDGRIHIKSIIIFASFAILGSLFCMVLLIFVEIDNTLLRILFATTLLISGLNMVRKAINTRKISRSEKVEVEDFSLKNFDYKSNLKFAIPLFFSAGFVAYLLGLGGGIIIMPSLNIVLGYPIHNATAMSTGIIFITAIFNTILKSFLGQIDYLIGIIMAVGSIGGAYTGAKISKRIPKMALQIIVAGVLMLLAIRMYF